MIGGQPQAPQVADGRFAALVAQLESCHARTERGEDRRLVCRAGNPFGLPAKDRSGRLDVTEPPDLGALLSSVFALFAANQGVPWPLAADDFSPDTLQRGISGQSGLQRFFVADGRPFCLYVVLGRETDRGPLVAQCNAVLRTLRIS